jgi:hypothetical protein
LRSDAELAEALADREAEKAARTLLAELKKKGYLP